jgi:hypothetical protein
MSNLLNETLAIVSEGASDIYCKLISDTSVSSSALFRHFFKAYLQLNQPISEFIFLFGFDEWMINFLFKLSAFVNIKSLTVIVPYFLILENFY